MNLTNENVIHVIKDDLQYIQFRKLLEYKNLVHCFTLKDLDFAGFDTYEAKKDKVENSYNKICKELNIEYKNICRPKQTHTDIIAKVEDGDEGIYNPKFYDVDSLMTNKKNKALVLSFADCTPLLFYDPVKNVIANTHSGWKGTYQRIAPKTVSKLVEEYGCKTQDIICCIGPHIRKCHFEVDKDVRDMFYEKYRYLNDIEKSITQNGEKYHIDTTELNKRLLLHAGLKEENIIDSKICTVCNSDVCHSYRKEREKSGRSISLIELVNI